MTPADARSVGEGNNQWRDVEMRVVIDTPYGADEPLEDMAHQGLRALAAALISWGYDPSDVGRAVARESTQVHDGTIEAVLMEHQVASRSTAGEDGWTSNCSCGTTRIPDMPDHQATMIRAVLS